MNFIYGKQDFPTWQRGQEVCFLLTNGLGGYAAATAVFSTPRCDQGILVAAVKAPNERITLVHRLGETLRLNGQEVSLSTQQFADGREDENGYRYLSRFSCEFTPVWRYDVGGVRVERKIALAWEENTAAVLYTIENQSGAPCALTVTPWLKFAPKESTCEDQDRAFSFREGKITDGTYTLYLNTNGKTCEGETRWQQLAYPEDAKDGRPPYGLAASCCEIAMEVEPGCTRQFEIVFSMNPQAASAGELLQAQEARLQALETNSPFADPLARQLVRSADAFVARRDSTGGKTILAGYPLFSDWGRDTMIALPGCCLATGRFQDAKSIIRTFLAYEQDGLVPNLFPEGGAAPMYNTVDAAPLLIDCVWQYIQYTGDWDFLQEAYPVMERIIAAYKKGTRHSIFMDEDGLISAGGGLDQVTWMDVCVEGILPTPRHGKPVEINAYWYNALRIMEQLAQRLGKEPASYGALAEKVKRSFREQFYMEDKGYLKDVISGTAADEQLRCNQIWAVSMTYAMLSPEEERCVVDTVRRHLYTPCGLRTLSPLDGEYHGSYGGCQMDRDMAYHQGTVWPFPLGAYYRAYLKTRGYSAQAARQVREELDALYPMMREGCVGQIPEIYDGDHPAFSKGCFAQAWSVGELLRVFETLNACDKE